MYLGWLITLAVLIPNAFYFFFVSRAPSQPAVDVEQKTFFDKAIETLEQIGRVAVFLIPCFYRINIKDFTSNIGFPVMLIAIGFYYLAWGRYFSQGVKRILLFSPFWGVPLPLAVSPVVYFLAAACVLHSVYLAAATVIFGVCHIYISHQAYQKLKRH
jgi:hypothetical protein